MNDLVIRQMNTYILDLQNRIQSLEHRVKQLEDKQINPYNIVSFTTVAVYGKMNLRPIAMAPAFGTPTQVSIAGQTDFEYDVKALQSLATLHKLLK